MEKMGTKRAYNSFVVVRCAGNKNVLVTQSAKKALALLEKGRRIEVWNCGSLVENIYFYEEGLMGPYIEAEREHIGAKQKRHEMRNERRRL